jgi:protein-S-isoprenylcysteine O-methyltransferase Ste14
MKRKPPPSRARWTDPLMSAVAAIGAYLAFRQESWTDAQLALAVSFAVALPLITAEIISAPWRKTAVPAASYNAVLGRAVVKWLGVMGGGALVLAGWSFLPEYASPAYAPFFEGLRVILPWVPPVCALWIVYSEWRLEPAKDYAWHTGMAIMGNFRDTDWGAVRNGLFGWLVRGVFLPLNFSALAAFIGIFRGNEGAALSGSWPHMQNTIIIMLSAILAASIVPGYFFGARLTRTQSDKVEQSWFGWAVTMSCYPPLMQAVFGKWLNFSDIAGVATAPPWIRLLQGSPDALYAVGWIILLLEIVHYWGEAAFGLRASNLSNRGIITNGPYRFCKHPVYLVKCLGWLLVWMPFAAGGNIWECLRLTLAWGGVCGIYIMRAWVEERLLSEDPAYVDYARWMDEHGLLAPLGRALPFFRYEWRLMLWKKRQ